jgi:hypothetical protein
MLGHHGAAWLAAWSLELAAWSWQLGAWSLGSLEQPGLQKRHHSQQWWPAKTNKVEEGAMVGAGKGMVKSWLARVAQIETVNLGGKTIEHTSPGCR